MPIMPRFSGCDAGTAADAEQRHRDRNLRLLGERDDFALAPDSMTPCPARISGRSAALISSIASRRRRRPARHRVRFGEVRSAASQSNSQLAAGRPW
jgi:hypothetical protein